MSKPSLKSQNVSPHLWYYEDRNGIDVVVEPAQHRQIYKIPWSMLKKSLKRCASSSKKAKK